MHNKTAQDRRRFRTVRSHRGVSQSARLIAAISLWQWQSNQGPIDDDRRLIEWFKRNRVVVGTNSGITANKIVGCSVADTPFQRQGGPSRSAAAADGTQDQQNAAVQQRAG